MPVQANFCTRCGLRWVDFNYRRRMNRRGGVGWFFFAFLWLGFFVVAKHARVDYHPDPPVMVDPYNYRQYPQVHDHPDRPDSVDHHWDRQDQ